MKAQCGHERRRGYDNSLLRRALHLVSKQRSNCKNAPPGVPIRIHAHIYIITSLVMERVLQQNPKLFLVETQTVPMWQCKQNDKDRDKYCTADKGVYGKHLYPLQLSRQYWPRAAVYKRVMYINIQKITDGHFEYLRKQKSKFTSDLTTVPLLNT